VEPVTKAEAESVLKASLGDDASFRPHQWEAIDSLVNEQGRLLLVQRTGWGKSTVYFTATRLLRDAGAGPTLIISPLLALMRNQVADASDELGLRAATINSGNTDEWDAIQDAAIAGDVDLLLISPERLADARFRRDVLDKLAADLGLVVIDEAHCISNWGHDFRPDYRRIKGVLEDFPDDLPIAATTATANDRVVEDITSQLPDLNPLKGDLVRESLRIQTLEISSRIERLAWIDEYLDDTSRSGIIYCLTIDSAETVAEVLASRGHTVLPYHGSMDRDDRRDREDALHDNDVDALVATSALGMGFNKPDLGWVIHYQRPPNLIRYYQEIGRAGRALDEAPAFLFSGPEDDEIAEYFIDKAFPTPEEFDLVLSTLRDSDDSLYKYELLQQADLSWQAASSCLNILEVEAAIVKEENGFVLTGNDWQYDHDRVTAVTDHRRAELERIKEFVETDNCLTRFIDSELDGQLTEDCGQCANCAGPIRPPRVSDESNVEELLEVYHQHSWQEIKPRYYMHHEDGGRSKIPDDVKPEPGRALTVYGAPGWGRTVSEDREGNGLFRGELVDAAASFIRDWNPSPAPEWVTAIPSQSHPGMVEGLGEQLAERLALPFHAVVSVTDTKQRQAKLKNSYQKCWNVSDAFEISTEVPDGPVLLMDDIVGSRWTLTEVSIELRTAGSGVVHPFALAERKRD
jgi:ATP-dependent DNA helicase RecQ